MKTIETDYASVTYDDSNEMRDKVFERVMQYFIDNKAFSGESIYGMDNPQSDAIETMSQLADDVIQFDVDWKI